MNAIQLLIAVAIAFAFCIFLFFRNKINQKSEPKRIKRAGKTSTLYFLYDPSVNKIKFGRATNFNRRFKTHLTSNRDLRIVRVFPETESFNETLIKRKFGQDEWVPFTDDLKRTILTGKIKN
jgi:hypothetical protein